MNSLKTTFKGFIKPMLILYFVSKIKGNLR